MLMQMITETVLGALTGYVTNHTAIRSLFQYGGVVEQTRGDFAREAGRLLEDQVLTRAVLEQQLQQPKVRQCLAEALEFFLQERLPEQLAAVRLEDLPDLEEICGVLQDLLQQFLEQEQARIVSLLKQHSPLESILTEEQCAIFCEKLQNLLLELGKELHPAEQFWQQWQAEKGDKTIEQLGLSVFCETITANLAQYSRQWPAQIKERYGKELEQLFLLTIQQLQLRPVLLELDQQMEQYTIRQYIDGDVSELISWLQKQLEGEKGQIFLSDLATDLVQALEQITVPASQVLPEQLLQQLEPILGKQLPELLEQLLIWLEQNKQGVHAMLESAVDEVAAECGGMKGLILQQLKDGLLEQVVQQTNFAAFLPQLLDGKQTNQQMAALFVEQIRSALQQQALGDLVQKFNRQDRLQQLLKELLQKGIKQLSEQHSAFLQQILDWKPGSLHLVQHQQQLEQWLAKLLVRMLDRIDVSAFLEHGGQKMLHKTAKQLIQPTEQQLDFLLKQLIQQGCSQLQKQLPQWAAVYGWDGLYDGLEQTVEQQGQRWIQAFIQRHSLEEVLQLVQPTLLRKQEEICSVLINLGLDLCQGRLAALAQQQIDQLSSDEMLQLVEAFMGRELQPLNYLGAGMGAAAGITVGTALSTAMPVTAVANPAMLVSMLAGKAAVFGAVGYGTNCAAVKGLFWPYQPIGGVDLLQGVIPRQKQRFAHSMGQLVSRYVINEKIVQQQIHQYGSQWLQEGWKTDSTLLLEQGAALLVAQRKLIVQKLFDRCSKQGAVFCRSGLERLAHWPLQLPLLDLEYKKMLEQLEQWLNQQLRQQISLSALLSGQQVWHLLQNWLLQQPVPDLTGLLQTAANSNVILADIISDQQMRQLKDAAQASVQRQMASEKKQATILTVLESLLEPQRIQQWLQKESDKWSAQWISPLFTLVRQAILQMLQSRQAQLTAAVQNTILNKLGLMQQMGYTMMGGDNLVAQIVDRVLHQKLPVFLTLKSKELQQLLAQYLQEHIVPAISQLSAEKAPIDLFLRGLLKQPELHKYLGKTAARTTQFLWELPVRQWIKSLRWQELGVCAQTKLAEQWKLHGAEALVLWRSFTERTAESYLENLTLAALTKGMTVPVPLADILQHDGLSLQFTDLLAALQKRLSAECLEKWLNWSALLPVLQESGKRILQDVQVQQCFFYKGQILLLQLAEHRAQLLPPNSQKILWLPFAQAVLETAEQYSGKLLAVVELPEVTERQLAAMDNQCLEQAVRSFADPYLVHIEHRGWLGAAFALPGMLFYLL